MRLIARNLCIARGGRRLAADVSFALEAGGALVLLGANGSGKTSLLRAIAGLLPLEGGSATLEDADDLSIADVAHYFGHDNALKTRLTPQENLSFWADMLGGDSSPDAIATALTRVGLPHVADLSVGVLSAGQKRRVALCRLLVAPRPLWLLDEPTTALDSAATALLAKLLAAHRQAGGMVIAATHADLALPGAPTLTLGHGA